MNQVMPDFRKSVLPFALSLLVSASIALSNPAVAAGVGVAKQDGVGSQKTETISTAKPAGSSKRDGESLVRELLPTEIFQPDFEDHDFDGTEDRAWEYRPYRVAVWFCFDGSPALNENHLKISAEVTRRTELMDASGWDITTGLAPARFRQGFLKYLDTPERCQGFLDERVFGGYDKVMIVCLSSENSRTRSRVREFDVQTQQWGPIADRTIGSQKAIAASVADSIASSFMPLARIERVTEVEYTDEEGKIRRRDEVVMQVRAVKSCWKTSLVESSLLPKELIESGDDGEAAENATDGEEQESDAGEGESLSAENKFVWVASPAESAPAFVQDADRFLPIIRKTDKKGNLVGLEPIELTFLTVDSLAGADLRASIQSSARAPLSQRASKRAQKLALVIRPPANSTVLQLISRDEETRLEGFEIYSRNPGQSLDEDSEYIGKTDWRGEIEIPPSRYGLRLIYVKRGSRALKKIPIIPGLYPAVTTTLPNDETRLYAEGVFKGLENETLGLVIRRKVAEGDLEAAIKTGVADDTRAAYEKLKSLEDFSDLKSRVNNAASDLKFLTNDSRERAFIDSQLKGLLSILDREQNKDRETELLAKVQEISGKDIAERSKKIKESEK